MAKRPPTHPVVAIVGTTGTGKSQLAVDLALKFNGEIINADAVQMYEGLPIITNKISLEEQNGIPHHLLGCVGLQEPSWRVDKYVKQAGQIMQEIQERGKLPIVVGGTLYYTQSLLFQDTLADGQSTDNQAREQEASEGLDEKYPVLTASAAEMYQKLQELDPVMASRWHPKDQRKIRRSLEIYYKTGRKASHIYAEQRARQAEEKADGGDGEAEDGGYASGADRSKSNLGLRHPTLFLWTHTPRDLLRERLRTRVDKMVNEGLLEEARDLEASARSYKAVHHHSIDETRGIFISIGYKEFLPYLAELEKAEDDVWGPREPLLAKLKKKGTEQTKIATVQYAKYQERWIRIKLLSAIKRAGAQGYITALDTSDSSAREQHVLQPSIEAAESFFKGDELPDRSQDPSFPAEARAAMDDFFHTRNKPKTMPQVQTCEVCKVTAATEQDWLKHTTSKRHRKTVAAKRKKALQSGHPTQQAHAETVSRERRSS